MDSNCTYFCYKNNKDKIKKIVDNPKKIKLVFFDMDGVLVDSISSWKSIHDYFGTSNQESVNEYLKGKINDLEFIKRDVLLWNTNGSPTSKDVIKNILYTLPLMNGAEELISFLRREKIKTAIVSAGLDILAEKIAEELGIDYVFANGIKEDENGRLTGEGILQVQLTNKEKNVEQLSKKLNIAPEHCAAIGNSCFDVPMFETTALGIAFNPEDECVRKSADIIVEGKDLRKIIPSLKPYL
ncbi:MAG: HAD-IB family phosphatase [Thermoplasmatota archaeon]